MNMNIATQVRIGYNIGRQKEITSPSGRRANPRTVLPHSPGMFSFLYLKISRSHTKKCHESDKFFILCHESDIL